jgi:accessory gene regulator B
MMVEKMCDAFSREIMHHVPDVDSNKAEAISFGLQATVSLIINTISLTLIAYFLNILEAWIILMIPYVSLRTFAGGYHLKSRITCWVTGVLSLMGATLFASMFYAPTWLIITIYLFSAVVLFLYAPADTESLPFLSHRLKRKLFVASFCILFFCAWITWALDSSFFRTLIAYGILLESIMLLPLCYKISGCKRGSLGGFYHIKWR